MFSATVMMIFALLLFLFGCMVFPMSDVATVITTLTAIVGAFAIWFQMKRERDIKEAEFIMEYNIYFVDNPDFVELEHRLEKYRKAVENGEKEKGLNQIISDENQQIIINYLVYLEAFAVFVKKNVLSIESIDNLFAYRFFLIMNNPEIQQKELCLESQYYQGCFWIYKKWSEYRRKKGLYIPLEDTSLDKTDEYRRINRV